MITRQIAGIEFQAHSPSLLEYHGAFLGFDGRAWRVGVRDEPWGLRRFKNAQEAGEVIREAFQKAREQQI